MKSHAMQHCIRRVRIKRADKSYDMILLKVELGFSFNSATEVVFVSHSNSKFQVDSDLLLSN